MAHNLATIRGKIAMAYQRHNPWHKLGVTLPPGVTVEDAIAKASMDYTVSLAPLYLNGGQLVDCRQAVLRDGNIVLGTVGPGYEPVQNKDAFDVVEALMGEGGMQIETLGALGQGETAWMLLRNGTEITVRDGDIVKPYLLVATSHDGTRAITAQPTAVRVVCQNTLNMVKERATIAVRHTASVRDRLDEAKRILARFGKAKEEATELYQAMAEMPLSPDALEAYWATCIPKAANMELVEERRAMLGHLALAGKGAGGATVWGAYNAVTEYTDHLYVARQDGTYRTHGAQSALFGGGRILRDKAWDEALALLGRN